MSKGQKDPTNPWPDGSTWVFQGTIAEDATAGTHICTLTVTPGAGNEMELLYGQIVGGATATQQVVVVNIKDPTNTLATLVSVADTASSIKRNFPTVGAITANTDNMCNPASKIMITGAQSLVLTVSTAAVSVTQTFALVCRLRSPKLPTATLADTVGTPTLTTNTNKIFG